MNYRISLLVRPKQGVRDPQGSAVEEALRGLGYNQTRVEYCGRSLSLRINAENAAAAKAQAEDMCKRLLVNPNLETYELLVNDTP